MLVCTPKFSGGQKKAQPTFIKKSTKPLQTFGKRVKPLTLKKLRRGKQNSAKLCSKHLKWVGNNIAGATSKWASVKIWVRMKSPAILYLQETKFKRDGTHKINGYIVYEHLRSEKTSVGGILMAVQKYLNPALVRDEVEEV